MDNLKYISAAAFALLIIGISVDDRFMKYPLLIVAVILFIYTIVEDRKNRRSN